MRCLPSLHDNANVDSSDHGNEHLNNRSSSHIPTLDTDCKFAHSGCDKGDSNSHVDGSFDNDSHVDTFFASRLSVDGASCGVGYRNVGIYHAN